jgi:hypothetical protein
MNMAWSIFIHVSALLFWALMCAGAYRAFTARGTNEKVRTHEDVVSVLRKKHD